MKHSTQFLNINTSYDHSRDLAVKQVAECRVDNAVYLPKRANPTDAGADLRSTEKCEIYPGETKMIDTGVAIKIPQGYGGFIFKVS